MSEKNSFNQTPTASRKKLENLWLRYYNAVLLEKGLITEDMFRKIEREILNRPTAPKKAK